MHYYASALTHLDVVLLQEDDTDSAFDSRLVMVISSNYHIINTDFLPILQIPNFPAKLLRTKGRNEESVHRYPIAQRCPREVTRSPFEAKLTRVRRSLGTAGVQRVHSYSVWNAFTHRMEPITFTIGNAFTYRMEPIIFAITFAFTVSVRE